MFSVQPTNIHSVRSLVCNDRTCVSYIIPLACHQVKGKYLLLDDKHNKYCEREVTVKMDPKESFTRLPWLYSHCDFALICLFCLVTVVWILCKLQNNNLRQTIWLNFACWPFSQ